MYILYTKHDLLFRKLLESGGRLAVKRRSGHLPYSQDPDGVLGAMNRSMLSDSESNTTNADREDCLKYYQHLFIESNQV